MSNGSQSWQREEAELQAVLASDLFARAPSLATLLEYICRKRFAGEDHLIKEYNIAVEALGRPADFDQKKDSIVRVEAHRLRKRLKQYYQREGAAHEIEIEIPARGYSPVFRDRSELGVAADAPGGHWETSSAENPEDLALWDTVPEFRTVSSADTGGSGVGFPWLRFSIVAATVLLIGAAVFAARWVSQSTNQAPLAAAPVQQDSIPNTPGAAAPNAADSTSEIRIACGSAHEIVDREGHVWVADRYYSGGSAKTVSRSEVDGTLNPDLFRQWREGSFQYRIPLKQGIYEVVLSMAEPFAGDGRQAPSESSRLFDVLINGQVVLNEFDLFAEAGAPGVANWRVFKDIQPDKDGFLTIQMRDRVGGALLNGIAVTPGSPGRLRPIRIGMRERPYTDMMGRQWVEDRYFSGGKLVKRIENISGTEDSEIYRNERYGRLKYTIPVPPESTYTLVLHFAETWFGGTGQGGEGSRIFDVLCNGQMLLSSFDVYREAGGPFRAIRRVFRGIRPRENGKIVLEMIPSKNYALLNALEVLDESPGDGRPQPKQISRK